LGANGCAGPSSETNPGDAGKGKRKFTLDFNDTNPSKRKKSGTVQEKSVRRGEERAPRGRKDRSVRYPQW